MTVITKIKAFYKYSGYRQSVLKKTFKKGILAPSIVLFLSAGFVLNYVVFIKGQDIQQIDVGKVLKLESSLNKSLPNTAVSTVPKAVSPEPPKQEAIKPPVEKEEVAAVKNKHDNVLERLNELEKENKLLKDDNIHLQNSLKIAASRGRKPRNYKLSPQITSRSGVLRGNYLGEFNVTAYTPTVEECGSDRGITSSGHPIVPGLTVAVDRKYWPVGTVFYVKGLGYVVAMDTGGAIKGKNRFDFAVLDKEYAKRIGRRKFDVYLIKMGTGKIEDISF